MFLNYGSHDFLTLSEPRHTIVYLLKKKKMFKYFSRFYIDNNIIYKNVPGSEKVKKNVLEHFIC